MLRYLSRRSLFALGAAALVLSALAMALLVKSASAAPADTIADRVYGQGGSFTSATCNLGGISASSLCLPFGVTVDGHLYVADADNNRVLEYDNPLTSSVADRVFGQAGSFNSGTSNLGGISASSLSTPTGVAIDAAGHLYIADADNNRVLEYDNPLTSQVADRVFGQGGSFTSGSSNLGGISASSLYLPVGVAVDAAGHLYVADTDNSRMLEYDNPLTNQVADRVFGKGGSFTSNGCNLGGISASSLCDPFGVAVDAAGHLYVVDTDNFRMLEYDNPLTSQVADRVFGQGGSFTSNTCNLGGISASSLCAPRGVAADAAGHLYAADTSTCRVLEYDSPLTSQGADRVFGQGGSFTSNTCSGFGASSLSIPFGVAVDAAGNLYVSDQGNNRVLEYYSPLGTPTPTPAPTANPNAVGGLVDLTTAGGGDGGSGMTVLVAGLLLAFAATGAAAVGFRRASSR